MKQRRGEGVEDRGVREVEAEVEEGGKEESEIRNGRRNEEERRRQTGGEIGGCDVKGNGPQGGKVGHNDLGGRGQVDKRRRYRASV